MKKLLVLFIALFLVGCEKNDTLTIATTTSVENSGLLAYILPVFEEETGYTVEVVAVGTGAALEMGRNGDADALLVHAKDQEIAFVEEGYGTERADIMYNDFIFIGPEEIHVSSLSEMMNIIIDDSLPFFSRGDNSGTHMKELSLWEGEGFDVSTFGDWYMETGQGMGDTINMANLQSQFTFCDRGTYLSMRDNIDLMIAYENPMELINQYGVIKVNPDIHKDNRINVKAAEAFYEWLLIPETQELIGTYEKYGEQLFHPNAK